MIEKEDWERRQDKSMNLKKGILFALGWDKHFFLSSFVSFLSLSFEEKELNVFPFRKRERKTWKILLRAKRERMKEKNVVFSLNLSLFKT